MSSSDWFYKLSFHENKLTNLLTNNILVEVAHENNL